MSPSKQAAFRVLGRVQGVGFRWWCLQQARELALEGAVRNVPDGSVEIQVAGEVFAVQQMMERLATGPRLARVSGVEAIPLEPIEGPGFRVV